MIDLPSDMIEKIKISTRSMESRKIILLAATDINHDEEIAILQKAIDANMAVLRSGSFDALGARRR